MYMAKMYCYGKDPNFVGVTGIVGCIGCVFVGKWCLYAVHIPDTGSAADGRTAFVNFVNSSVDGEMGTAGTLHIFVNGKGNRLNVAQEASELRNRLNRPVTTVYRIVAGLKNEDRIDQKAATILVRRASVSSVKMHYKHVPTDQWMDGGSNRSGCYDGKFAATFDGGTKPQDCINGWNVVNSSTCQVEGIHG